MSKIRQTRTSWLKCALRGDEVIDDVIFSHITYEMPIMYCRILFRVNEVVTLNEAIYQTHQMTLKQFGRSKMN